MPNLIPQKRIETKILLMRGENVILDRDLAELYEVATKVFNQAVKRNIKRFPKDFMFQLTKTESDLLRSQIVTLKEGRGKHYKYMPYVFTEQGVAMLSSVLNSERAIQVNIQIMRTFTELRKMAIGYTNLNKKIEAMERKYDRQFKIVFDAIRQLLEPPPKIATRVIGFKSKKD
jgi:hypothetical protein